MNDRVQAALAGLPGGRLIVGVSGGRDSMALLHALAQLGRHRLVVAHLDHRLRGRASTADAAFVRRHAALLGLPVFVGRADTRTYSLDRGISLELAARELRHTFFFAAAKHHRCPRVVLAHHADDQIETILHNFLRGSGPAGLAGMRFATILENGRRRLTLFRPLLEIRSAGLAAFADEHRIRFREDASNRDPSHTRNRLRHDLLPAVERAVGPAFADAILRNARIFAAEDDLLCRTTETFPIASDLSVHDLRVLDPAIRRRVVRRWLIAHEVSEPGLAEVDRVLSLIEPGAAVAKVNLPGDLHARRSAGRLFVQGPALGRGGAE